MDNTREEQYTDVLIFEDSESLGLIYDKLKELCEKYSEEIGDKFSWTFDIDWDKLELTWTQTFKGLPNHDYTEGDPKLN